MDYNKLLLMTKTQIDENVRKKNRDELARKNATARATGTPAAGAAASETGTGKGVCKQWQKSGSCSRGDNCPWAHTGTGGKGKGKGKGKDKKRGRSSSPNQRAQSPPPKPRSASPEGAKKPCRFYMKGNCNKGKDCEFHHPPKCKFFSSGKCTQGNKCKFFHERTASVAGDSNAAASSGALSLIHI